MCRPSATSHRPQARTLASDARSSSINSSPPPGFGLRPDLLRRGMRLRQIARGTDDFSAVRRQGARRLDAEAGRDAGDEDAFAMQIDTREHLVGR